MDEKSTDELRHEIRTATDMEDYLEKHRYRMRDAAGLVSDYYKSTSQDYVVHCEIREGKTPLLDLSVTVPDRAQAEAMCSQWEKRARRSTLSS